MNESGTMKKIASLEPNRQIGIGRDMPSKSPAQARLMAAVAHDPKFAKKVGIPQSVGQDFNQADAGTGILSEAKRTQHGPRPAQSVHQLGQMRRA